MDLSKHKSLGFSWIQLVIPLNKILVLWLNISSLTASGIKVLLLRYFSKPDLCLFVGCNKRVII